MMKINTSSLEDNNGETPESLQIEQNGHGSIPERGSLIDDAKIEDSLIHLYSHMDQHIIYLDNIAKKDPYSSISTLLRMLNDCAEFSENVLNLEPESNFLANLVSNVSDTYSHIRLLHVRKNRISDSTVQNLYKGWTGEASEKELVFNEISSGMVQILKTYLSFFSSCFSSPHVSEEWEDVCLTFSEDLDKTLKSVAF